MLLRRRKSCAYELFKYFLVTLGIQTRHNILAKKMRKKQKLLPSISEVLFLVILIRIASVFGKYLGVF